MKYWALIAVGLVFAACDKNDEFAEAPSVEAPAPAEGAAPAKGSATDLPQNHPTMPTNAPQAGAALPGSPVSFNSVEEFGKTGALLWEAPEGWEARKPSSSMRLAEYIVNAEAGPAELTIFYFGVGGGGGVDANITRWIGQFSNPDGSAVNAERSTLESPVKTHLVSAEGTFNPGMAGSSPPKEGQKMLGAIAESSVGLFFFKLVGPKATVDANAQAFDSFVKSFKPGKS